MTASASQIRVQDIDHCGIVAGIIDEMCLVEQINQILGTHHQEIVTPGQAVKAMILNGLGLVSAPLYLFEKFFVGKATEHLLGEGISPEHLNDDRLGRVLDKLYEAGLTQVFVTVALAAAFAQILKEFRQQWQIDALFVADAALYCEESIKQMDSLRWLSRVPATLAAAKFLLDNMSQQAFVNSAIEGYQIAECCSDYAGVKQRWLVVNSEARRKADLKQLEKRLAQQLDKAQSQLRQLSQQEFACAADALKAANLLSSQLRFHQLTDVEIIQHQHHHKPGRPSKNTPPTHYCYQIRAAVVPKPQAIASEQLRAGRFILATNIIDANALTSNDLLREYKAQQSTERGFRFLKDPLFFTSSVFLNSPERVAALAMVMGLCLLVYSLGQRALRQALETAKQTITNQLGKPTATPTLRWVFQCFMSIHLVTLANVKQIANLTDERRWILQFLGAPCRKYYLIT